MVVLSDGVGTGAAAVDDEDDGGGGGDTGVFGGLGCPRESSLKDVAVVEVGVVVAVVSRR